MAKHNYSQYSNKKTDKVESAPEVAVEVQNGVEPIVTEEVETVTTNAVEAVEAETVVTETVKTDKAKSKAKETKSGAVAKGVVANCAKLNVRSKPNAKADAIAVLNADDEIKIDVDKSTDEWFKVLTIDGVKGYCMRKFINANI